MLKVAEKLPRIPGWRCQLCLLANSNVARLPALLREPSHPHGKAVGFMGDAWRLKVWNILSHWLRADVSLSWGGIYDLGPHWLQGLVGSGWRAGRGLAGLYHLWLIPAPGCLCQGPGEGSCSEEGTIDLGTVTQRGVRQKAGATWYHFWVSLIYDTSELLYERETDAQT